LTLFDIVQEAIREVSFVTKLHNFEIENRQIEEE